MADLRERFRAADAVTVNVAVLDPLTGSLTVVFPIESRGPSSSVMVPVAVPRSIVALVAPLRLTSKRSSGSVTVSPQTVTVACWLVTPGLKVSSPLVDA